MATIVQQLGLSGNPFEHYTAETEPNITAYAVRPPYLEAISARVAATSSFILFGDRGAGKSATRITIFNQMWPVLNDGVPRPLVVNFTDFGSILPSFQRGTLTDSDLVNEVAFVVVGQVMVWLSTLSDEDREARTEQLSDADKDLAFSIVNQFYLNRPSLEREFRTTEAYNLLNSAFIARGAAWVARRWDQIAGVIGGVAAGLAKAKLGEAEGVGPATASLFKSLKSGEANAARAVLARLVSFVQVFGFSGVSVLVDKIDETEATTASAEKTTKLIHPLISHIQLLEVPGFAWVFFLWSKVKTYFDGDALPARLDKIANSVIAWNPKFFREMLDARIRFFSQQRHEFADLFDDKALANQVFSEVCENSMGSPREMVKILDIIIREHDARYSDTASRLLDRGSVEVGLDKYVTDVINTVFNEKTLGQIYRIKSSKFINGDVQNVFKVNAQNARNKIKSWEDIGLVRYVGTRAAEGDLGGKPSYEYAICDARGIRIMRRDLVQIDEEIEGEE